MASFLTAPLPPSTHPIMRTLPVPQSVLLEPPLVRSMLPLMNAWLLSVIKKLISTKLQSVVSEVGFVALSGLAIMTGALFTIS